MAETLNYNLIIMRHGKSLWNQENRFTGWTDIDLSPQGVEEARRAALRIKKNGFLCDLACTSLLKRAIRTLWIVLEETDQMWVPVLKSWRLNERHYGLLTGWDKTNTINKYGAEQVQKWRRSYDLAPPPMSASAKDPAGAEDPAVAEDPAATEKTPAVKNLKDRRYKSLSLPLGESLQQTKERVMPFWRETVAPALKEGKKVLITAHGNSLRALIKHIENLNDEEIVKVEVPTACPLAYQLSQADLSVKTPRTAL